MSKTTYALALMLCLLIKTFDGQVIEKSKCFSFEHTKSGTVCRNWN